MSIQFSDELIYSKAVSAHGNYKYLRVVPIGSTGQNFTLSNSSTTMTQFELPNNVLNLSKSKLCFDINLVAGGAAHFNNLYANALSLIDRITLTSRSGVILADIPNTHIFGSLVSSCNTKVVDLLTRTPSSLALSADATASVALTASQLHPVNDIVRCNGTVNLQVGSPISYALGGVATTNILTAYTPNSEPATLFYSAVDNNSNAMSYQIDLSAFKDTLMEINKNIYFGDNLVLTINWNAGTKFTFTSFAINNATTGVVGAGLLNYVFPVASALGNAAIPSITNLFLYTACETDPTIISQLVSTVSSGEFSLMVPFVYCQKYATSTASTTSAIQQRMNSSYGHTLLRTYFGVYHATETEATAYTHHDGTVIDYNTYMDGLRLQDFTLRVADSTHWLYNERNLKDSCIQSLQQYKTNFMHIDNWCGASPCNNDDTMLNGLSLDTDRTWSIQLNTASAAYKFYLFFTTQKRLVISKGILSVV